MRAKPVPRAAATVQVKLVQVDTWPSYKAGRRTPWELGWRRAGTAWMGRVRLPRLGSPVTRGGPSPGPQVCIRGELAWAAQSAVLEVDEVDAVPFSPPQPGRQVYSCGCEAIASRRVVAAALSFLTRCSVIFQPIRGATPRRRKLLPCIAGLCCCSLWPLQAALHHRPLCRCCSLCRRLPCP